MSENIIELTALTKKYGTLTAVDCLDLSIRKGEVFGLLGPNGAGKSTTILMMLGLTAPTSGSVKVCGIDSTKQPIDVKRRTGYLPDEVGFYDNRSGLDNLLYTARLNRMPAATASARATQLLERVGLYEVRHKKTRTYSRGMRQRLGLADVLIKNPEVIILDEPTLGIDPVGVQEFLHLIVQLSREEKITVLLSSHHLHQVQQVCDRVGIFVEGKLLAAGDIPALSAQLFRAAPYTIEAGVCHSAQDASHPESTSAVIGHVLASLKNIQGISDISYGDGMFRAACSRDVTAYIAHAIVHAGLGMTFLRRKEYGLDDIYNRYFQGSNVHEQTA